MINDEKLPPIRAYRAPPKYPLTGDVAAYMKIPMLTSDPRLKVNTNKSIAILVTPKILTLCKVLLLKLRI